MESYNELQHWGIKGQKWGVRRYQNPDGSYTEEGIRRYQKKYPYQNPDGSLTEAGKTNYMKAARKNQLDYKNLSDKDLDMINNRFNKENQYKRNIENYEKSTFKYKVKEALISRIKGNNGGDGGKKKGKGGGGNSVLTKLLVAPIKKAFEDALKENNNGGKGSKGDSDESKDKDKDTPKNAPKNASNSNSSISRLAGWTMSKNLDDLERDGYVGAGKKAAPKLFNRIDEIEKNGYSGVHKTWSNMNSSRLDDIEREGWTRHSGLYAISRSDELYHHGIKGQKWGVRRFENPDGTLTPEGQQRYYGKRFEKESKKQERLNYKADQATQIRLAKDHASKAKKNLATGLAGAASAAAGYGLLKAHGPNALSVQRISGYDASTGKRFSYMQDAHKLILPAVGLLGVAIGSPTAVVGLGKAAYHGIRASVANSRASIAGHQKAAQKAKAHLEGMKEMFSNTPYAALVDEKFG